MTRSYDEPIGMGPDAFVWRGRRYAVRGVLAHWIEVGPWWHAAIDLQSADAADSTAAGSATTTATGSPEREVWRVEATPDPAVLPGVYDVCCDGAGGWRLVRTID